MSDDGDGPAVPAGAAHLRQLPDQIRSLGLDVDPAVLGLVDAEHAAWRQLHDRLVALIAALLDVAVEGRGLQDVIDQMIAGATVDLDALVSAVPDAHQIASLLRAHGSTGSIVVDEEVTTFTHECGTGLRYWRDNPDVVTVAEGEVDGVPAGRPRYCARCIRSINEHGTGWDVRPPLDPSERCVWTLTKTPAMPDPG